MLYLIKTHPLVFRNKKATSKSFPKELKYAIADLFRDYHITQNAYNLNLHKNSLLSKLADKKTDIPGKQRVIGVATLLHASILRVFA